MIAQLDDLCHCWNAGIGRAEKKRVAESWLPVVFYVVDQQFLLVLLSVVAQLGCLVAQQQLAIENGKEEKD